MHFRLLRKAIRHSDAVLTYAPTYWPKDGICAWYVAFSITFCRDPFASRPTKFAAQPADRALPWSAARCSTYQIPIKRASHFPGSKVLWISSRISSARIRTHFASMLQHVCQNLMDAVCATFVGYIRVRDRPHWSPSAMNAAALTHCAKIWGFTAQYYESLRTKQKSQRVKDREQCSQKLRIQTPYSLGKKSRPTSRGGRLEISPPQNVQHLFIEKCPCRRHPLMNIFWRT